LAQETCSRDWGAVESPAMAEDLKEESEAKEESTTTAETPPDTSENNSEVELPTKEEMAKEKAVKEKEAWKNNEEVSKEAPKTEGPKDFTKIIVIGLLIAVLGVLMQQQDLLSGEKTPSRWVQEIFEPHKVPPPVAPKNQVTIQFCQS